MAEGCGAKRASTSAAAAQIDEKRAKRDQELERYYNDEMDRLLQENARNPQVFRALEERRLRHKKYAVSQTKLRELHRLIVEKQELFVKERKKWIANHRHLRSDMNQYFVERCQWETEFKETYLKPLYEERRIAAQGIQHFWSTSILSDRLVKKQITDKDGEALEYLNDIKSSRTTDLRGFELKFTFDDNPWFNNKVLTKTYEVTGDNDSASLKAIGTKIDWNSHKLTEKKSGKRCKSFFNFFKSYATVDPLSFDIEADKLEGDLPEDYEIGTKFRDKIIPQPFLPPNLCFPV